MWLPACRPTEETPSLQKNSSILTCELYLRTFPFRKKMMEILLLGSYIRLHTCRLLDQTLTCKLDCAFVSLMYLIIDWLKGTSRGRCFHSICNNSIACDTIQYFDWYYPFYNLQTFTHTTIYYMRPWMHRAKGEGLARSPYNVTAWVETRISTLRVTGKVL